MDTYVLIRALSAFGFIRLSVDNSEDCFRSGKYTRMSSFTSIFGSQEGHLLRTSAYAWTPFPVVRSMALFEDNVQHRKWRI